MKRTILTAMAALLMTTAAYADKTLHRNLLKSDGKWNAWLSVGPASKPVCVLDTIIKDKGVTARLAVFFYTNERLFMQLTKSNWAFKIQGRKDIKAVIEMDDKTQMSAPGFAYNGDEDGRSTVQFWVAADYTNTFMNEFIEADKMTIKFDGGNEPKWIVDMSGTRKTGAAFSDCVRGLGGVPRPEVDTSETTPFDSQPEKPADKLPGA